MIHIAVCMPSMGRADQMYSHATELLFQERPGNVHIWLILAVVAHDTKTIEAGQKMQKIWNDATDTQVLIVEREPGSHAVDGWNKAYNSMADTADWFVLGADDIIWHQGWIEEALQAADDGTQVIGLNDGHTNIDEYAPHYMVSREFARIHLGGVLVPPVYRSWWFDREVCQKGQALGLYAPAWKAWAEHRHPDWRTAPMDETYETGWPLHDADRDVYLQRRAAGYPLDYLVRLMS